MKTNFFYAWLIAGTLFSCGDNTPVRKKGTELIGQEAVDMLAGDEKRAWKLVEGHSFYDYFLFDTHGGAVVFDMEPPVPYHVVGDELVFEEESYKTFFTILEISNDTLLLQRNVDTSASDALVEPLVYMNLETYRSKGIKQPEDFFLKGKSGTVWSSDDDNKNHDFIFMNDGRIIHKVSNKEIGTWSLDENADRAKSIFPVKIYSSDYIKFQWGDTLLEMHYSGQATNK